MPLAPLHTTSWPRRRLAARALIAAFLGAIALVPAGAAQGAPKLRMAADQRGDFLLIGNTLGHECGNAGVPPVLGTVTCNGSGDSAPDIHWRSDEPSAGMATANPTITPAQQRSTAYLTLPPGATVTHARLYWAARLDTGAPDLATTLERPGVFSQDITADDSILTTHNPGGVVEYFYQSTADITALVKAQGSGAYRLSGVDSINFVNKVEDRLFAAWEMVVFYELPSEKPRHLMMFDGLDKVGVNAQSIKLSGFTVPGAAIDGKLGVIAYEGDVQSAGGQNDYLRFGIAPLADADTLSDPVNPATNFFNGSRGWLGMPQSIVGDLPQLTGTPGSMSGVDIDVVDISTRIKAGQKSADVEAGNVAPANDIFFLGGFVASIATLLPDFSTSTKSVADNDGGKVVVGDELTYTIVVKNTGNDTSINTVMTDPLPLGVSFVPGSLEILDGPNAGPKTDAPNDDQGEYDPNTRTVTVRIGTGATQTKGGELSVDEASTVRFRVKVDPGAPASIQNQATISAEGKQGAPVENYPTDGNGVDPGSPPTTVTVEECQTNADCGNGPKPICDVGPDPNVCVGCLNDAQCPGEKPTCDQGQKVCVCIPSGAEVCDGKDNNCDGKVDEGCADSDGDGLSDSTEVLLGTDPNDADTDNDGVPDGQEIDPGGDADGDGIINALDPDSDNDGIFDGTEMGKDCSGPGTDPKAGNCVPDADGGKTTTNPLDPDTDKGGIPDGVEDKNHDGAVDPGEGDPNNPADDTTSSGTGGAGGAGGSGGATGSGGAGGGSGGAGGASGGGGASGSGGTGGEVTPGDGVYVSGSGLFGACAAGTGTKTAGGALGLFGLLGLAGLLRRRKR